MCRTYKESRAEMVYRCKRMESRAEMVYRCKRMEEPKCYIEANGWNRMIRPKLSGSYQLLRNVGVFIYRVQPGSSGSEKLMFLRRWCRVSNKSRTSAVADLFCDYSSLLSGSCNRSTFSSPQYQLDLCLSMRVIPLKRSK